MHVPYFPQKTYDSIDGKIIWLRAHGERWKTICWTVGMARTAAHRHWLYGLCVLAWKLNGRRIPRNRSRLDVIAMVQSAKA